MISTEHWPSAETEATDRIPYSNAALRQDLLRVRQAWDRYQKRRERDAVYGYLAAVYMLVGWWSLDNRALTRARRALVLSGNHSLVSEEPFAAIIECTSDPDKVDKKIRSKWSRVLRYALARKPDHVTLENFVKKRDGINRCATLFTKHLGRPVVTSTSSHRTCHRLEKLAT